MNNRKLLVLSFYAILFIYPLLGFTIHHQYGFGFFYFPVQQFVLFIISVIYFAKFPNSLKKLYITGYIYHLLFIIILIMQLFYLFNISYVPYLEFNYLVINLINLISWYFISLMMVATIKYLVEYTSIKILVRLFILIVILFFLFIIKLHNGDLLQALTLGTTVPGATREVYLGWAFGFHLFFSPIFSIFSIYYLYMTKNKISKNLSFVSLLLMLYVLFLAGGRGTFIAYLTTIVFLFSNKKMKIIVILIFTSIYFLVQIDSVRDFFLENNPRIYYLLTMDLSQDASAIGREQLLEDNLNYISENYFTGGLRAYMGIGKGVYIHNILAFLEEYGIVPFFLLISLIIHGLFIINKLRKFKSKIYFILRTVFIYTLIEIVLFKTVKELTSVLYLIVSYYGLLFVFRDSKKSQKKFTHKKEVQYE